MKIVFTHKGDFRHTEEFLKKIHSKNFQKILDDYGQLGVIRLAESTPKDTGLTAASWYYEIRYGKDEVAVVWKNSNIVKGYPIAIILQYGHGTGNGGYVRGIDYINPAMRPVFREMANAAWREVTGK